jgi:hypothetical protein
VVIKYQVTKNAMKVFSDAKVLSSEFKKCFLSRLTVDFDLYEDLNGKIRILNTETIEESAKLSESEIAEHKKCYELEKMDDISFDEFLEFEKIAFADIYVIEKGQPLPSTNFKKAEGLLAVIDLAPDGDTDSIWIDIIASKIVMQILKQIEKYNLENEN